MADLSRQAIPLGHRPGLVLVDMIEAFTDASSPLGSSCESVVDACGSLLQLFRERELPVFFTTVVYDSEDEAAVFRRRLPALNMLQRGSAASRVDQRLAPASGEVLIEKHYASAFFDTSLADHLREKAVDSLVVVGLTTSGCVRATAVDGLQHGYPVWLVREAVGDRNAEAHAANLHDLHAKYAEVVELATLGKALGGSQ